MGPTGPAGASVAVPAGEMPPPAYTGDFMLVLDGSEVVRLSGFAGCYEKTAGGEPEDCHLTAVSLSPSLTQWLNTSLTGNTVLRSFEVHQYNVNFQTMARVVVHDAFLREFRVSNYSSDDPASTALTFVVVPERVQYFTGGTLPQPTLGVSPRRNRFQLSIGGEAAPHVRSIQGLRVTWAKLVEEIGTHRLPTKAPGPPVFDNIVVTMDMRNETAELFEGWWAQAQTGAPSPRNGALDQLHPSNTNVMFTFNLQNLRPLQFPPFGFGPHDDFPRPGQQTVTQRFMILKVGGFTVQ